MSEYQYYEFRAIDRPLTAQETAKLRALSSRARINSTSFVNVYNYGDFRGDPDALMERYFDAFVYVANWGTHRFMLRVPEKSLANPEVTPYCDDEALSACCKGGRRILSFCAQEVEVDWDEGEGWMDALLPIRDELLRGDFRALYLGWLRAVQDDGVDSDQLEPPVAAWPAHSHRSVCAA